MTGYGAAGVAADPDLGDRGEHGATVIKDKFISASALCTAVGASVCTAAGITP